MHMCNAFAKLGYEVTLLGLAGKKTDHDEILDWYGVSGFKLALSTLRVPKLSLHLHARFMLRKVKQIKPDVIFGRSLFGAGLLLKNGFKLGFETHDPIEVLQPRQKRVFEAISASDNLKCIVVISNVLKQMLIEKSAHVTEGKVKAIHDGATVQEGHKVALDQYKWPLEKGQRIQIGYVGTISQGRGIELILLMAEKLPKADFHIIGALKQDLSKINMDAEGEYPNVYFHGFVSPKEASIARRHCDILLAPYQENIKLKSGKNTSGYMSPLKIFEYMEAGKPIVVSDLPVLHEVIVHQVNGLFCAPTNVEEWVKAIELLTEKPDLRKKMGENGRKDIEEKLSWEKRAEHIIRTITKQEAD